MAHSKTLITVIKTQHPHNNERQRSITYLLIDPLAQSYAALLKHPHKDNNI